MKHEPIAAGFGGESVYDALRREILRLELGPGSELDENVVSARYGVSRTPVREALIRLTAEGLVTSTRGRGARVAALDLRNLRDFLEGIDIFQRAVTRLAALRRRPRDIEAIEAQMLAFENGARALDSDVVNETNYAFHAAIGEAARSSHLAAAYRRSLGESLRIAYVCYSEHSDVDQRLEAHLEATMREHRTMFDAIVARDAEAAEAVAGNHVDLYRGRIITTLMSTDTSRRISVGLTADEFATGA
ncbi:MAG: transcriptional regulator [Rhizobiaceae bacterium]|jgi:DNA-binding GntR family transcriptional regulator|nr:transcriptional regulator [Rhizobiaceae bacterium]